MLFFIINSFLNYLQLTMERSETETKQRYNNQIQRLENEIVQFKKKLEQEVEQRHALERNQDVRWECALIPLSCF